MNTQSEKTQNENRPNAESESAASYSERWFYTLMGEAIGPRTYSDLRLDVQSKRLTPEMPVRREGTQKWINAIEINGLFENIEIATDALPHVCASNFPLERSIEEAIPRNTAPLIGKEMQAFTVLLSLLLVLTLLMIFLSGGKDNKHKAIDLLANVEGESTSKTQDNTGKHENQNRVNLQSPAIEQSSPESELFTIAQRGKEKLPSGSITLTDLHVDVQETSSVIYPHVGRIVSTWDIPIGQERFWVFYKHDGTKWIPTWATKGSMGTIGPLTFTEATTLPSDLRMRYPWETSNFQVWAWVP